MDMPIIEHPLAPHLRCPPWMAMRRVLVTAAVLLSCASSKPPTLYQGDCRVVAPEPWSFGCQVAAFGGYLPPQEPPPMRLCAPIDDPVACAMAPAAATFQYCVVVVRRGDCAFQQKLANVASGGALGMIVVNTDDSLPQLGTLEFAAIDAFAVSVSQSSGDRLLQLVAQSRSSTSAAEFATVSIGSLHSTTRFEQASRRITYLMSINAPQVAVETFYAALPVEVQDVDDVLQWIIDEPNAHRVERAEEVVNFLRQCVAVLPDAWQFSSDAIFHASAAAAALTRSHDGGTQQESDRTRHAISLLGRGYYAHAASLLSPNRQTQEDETAVIRCLRAFIHLLQGSVLAALEHADGCTSRESQFNVTAAGLDVSHDNFLRLAALQMSATDKRCLKAASSREDSDYPGTGTGRKALCCRSRIPAHIDSTFGDEDQQAEVSSVQRRRSWYRSAFVEELYHTMNVMGVFMDEQGAFHESLHFFGSASRLCEDWSSSLEFRQALAIPIVFDSTRAIDAIMANIHGSIDDLKSLRKKQVLVLSSSTGAVNYRDHFARPEDATHLRYTITPSTMFVGYQGYDPLSLQQEIFALRSFLFPSLNSRFQAINRMLHHPEAPRRRRIAFISSWFRNHSVGKLILGVIKRLDRSKFHVMVYRSVHFLRSSDELTNEFHHEADSYMELPVDQEAAVALLRHEAIDVLVYPELGMDAWTLLLAHHRVAPVQCVFWGHPITTGNPAIDYFVTSEYFIADFFEDGADTDQVPQCTADGETTVWPGAYHGSSFSEQVVLFRGLSTFFTNKHPTGQPRRSFQRSMLHLPANARLYVCPQTLMKLHPDFDEALLAILARDPLARIILLSSPTQRVWTEQLRRRFRRRFGQAHRRVLFYATLPYDDFMGLLAAADVVLDPFPFGGGVTTLDALAVGSPVVTLPAAQTVPQLAAGFLRYIDVVDTIATDVDGFVALALAIACDAERRQSLRERILAQHRALYEDEASLDDWNAFLDAVAID